MANSLTDPRDPDYCETCGGECVAGCRREAVVEEITAETVRVHRALTLITHATFAQEDALVMLSVYTFEVGRIAGVLARGMTEAQQENMLLDIMDTMRRHIREEARRG